MNWTYGKALTVGIIGVAVLGAVRSCYPQEFPPKIQYATVEDLANLGTPKGLPPPHRLLILCSPGSYKSEWGGVTIRRHGLNCHYGFLDEGIGKPTGTVHIEIGKQI